MAGKPTIVQIDWPEPPRFKITEDQIQFNQFYYQLKTAIAAKLDELAAVIDEKADAT